LIKRDPDEKAGSHSQIPGNNWVPSVDTSHFHVHVARQDFDEDSVRGTSHLRGFQRVPSETESLPHSESLQDGEVASQLGENEMALKGVKYPGMRCIDLATSPQKKQRNQKKHESVVKNMKLDSSLVERLEMVMDLEFNIQRSRDVYDTPSIEGSPVHTNP
jgi:hypothetical protein